ncbi:MAG: ChrR family anti-sigma-E factor [Rhodospirillales bacterium]
MTIQHHPSDELLLDYASGALGEAWSLAVATHLSLCPACRSAMAEMETIGAGLLDAATPVPLSNDALEMIMQRLESDDVNTQQPAQPVRAQPSGSGLPQPLSNYAENGLGEIDWQRLGLGASQYLIPTGDHGVTARLLRIPAGRPVPEHTHGGLELTLVLSGAFSDQIGRFGPGDFQEADGSLQHQPRAEPGADCICLAVTDAPLRFKSLAARMVQPFLGI